MRAKNIEDIKVYDRNNLGAFCFEADAWENFLYLFGDPSGQRFDLVKDGDDYYIESHDLDIRSEAMSEFEITSFVKGMRFAQILNKCKTF